MKTVRTLFIAMAICLAAGCVQKQVRVDLNTYQLKPDAYAGRNVEIIITASLQDVLARYDQYLNKKIEVTAPVSRYSNYGFWTWYMVLQEDDMQLRCYTHHYRIEPGYDAVNLLERAIHNKAPVTALGILRKDGLDLQRMESDGESVTTSFKPPRPWGLWPFH